MYAVACANILKNHDTKNKISSCIAYYIKYILNDLTFIYLTSFIVMNTRPNLLHYPTDLFRQRADEHAASGGCAEHWAVSTVCRTLRIRTASRRCVCAGACSDSRGRQTACRIRRRRTVFHRCACAGAVSGCSTARSACRTGRTCTAFPWCGRADGACNSPAAQTACCSTRTCT